MTVAIFSRACFLFSSQYTAPSKAVNYISLCTTASTSFNFLVKKHGKNNLGGCLTVDLQPTVYSLFMTANLLAKQKEVAFKSNNCFPYNNNISRNGCHLVHLPFQHCNNFFITIPKMDLTNHSTYTTYHTVLGPFG